MYQAMKQVSIKCKRTEIIQTMFSDHSGLNLKINRRKFLKFTNKSKLINSLQNIQKIKEEITRKVRKYFEIHENENMTYQIYGMELTQYRDIYSCK